MTNNQKYGNGSKPSPKSEYENIGSLQQSSGYVSAIDLAKITIESITKVFSDTINYQRNSVNFPPDVSDNLTQADRLRQRREMEEYCAKYAKRE
ncbi:hypothetical protein A6S26_15435 [Nostoc sp. ATCC 43529]|nr:hypothetical protein A6S26_15435 [Nostoc sp. ATCC 43529]